MVKRRVRKQYWVIEKKKGQQSGNREVDKSKQKPEHGRNAKIEEERERITQKQRNAKTEH